MSLVTKAVKKYRRIVSHSAEFHKFLKVSPHRKSRRMVRKALRDGVLEGLNHDYPVLTERQVS